MWSFLLASNTGAVPELLHRPFTYRQRQRTRARLFRLCNVPE
jgi:hypothetical protein